MKIEADHIPANNASFGCREAALVCDGPQF